MPDAYFNTLVQWLSTPGAYPHQPARVDVVDTHISVVFLADQLVYKLKRPVKYDFLDFTAFEKREQACRDEVQLNRRLAPDVYLDVVPITREADGNLQLNGKGLTVDWLVQMRRLPIEKTLDQILSRKELRPEHIVRLARVLADFYRSLAPLSISPQEYCDRYAAHVYGNLNELLTVPHHCSADTVRRVHGFQLQILRLRPELFEQRIQSGRIVEGHGDLRPEHICFSDPLVIFDCIEFNLDFRRIDIADELSFLATECDFLGAVWIGPQLFQTMSSLIGDRPPAMLIDFYKSYRACVRAKVNALRADQLTGSESEAAAKASARHLQFANSYVQRWARPLVMVVGGLSGTGKSTLATHIANSLGCELLQTDVIRRQLYGKSEKPAVFDRGNYSRDARESIYAELIRQADALHRRGVSVVLDGTFSMAAALSDARQIVRDERSIYLGIECTCDPAISRQRIARRLADGASAAEIRPEFQQQQLVAWQPWPEDKCHIRIDTQQSLNTQLGCVITALKFRSQNK